MSKKFLTPIVPPKLAADPAGVEGAIYYNTVTKTLRYFDGTIWSAIGTGSGGGEFTGFPVLAEAPSDPVVGQAYYDSEQRTVRAFNGVIWYDVAGPKELLDHTHYAGEGPVRDVNYGGYIPENMIFINGGNSYTVFSDDIINGGNSQ